MEHEIVERPGRYDWRGQSPDYRPWSETGRVRHCKHCGLSERYIKHFGRTECRHQSEGE